MENSGLFSTHSVKNCWAGFWRDCTGNLQITWQLQPVSFSRYLFSICGQGKSSHLLESPSMSCSYVSKFSLSKPFTSSVRFIPRVFFFSLNLLWMGPPALPLLAEFFSWHVKKLWSFMCLFVYLIPGWKLFSLWLFVASLRSFDYKTYK